MPTIDTWRSGLKGEIAFWELFKRVHPDWFAGGMDTSRALDEDVDAAVSASTRDAVRILDVGSGMLSSLGHVPTADGKSVAIRYADALADEFARIAREQGFTLPITCDKVYAENLLGHYGYRSFEIIYCRNALDHCLHPALAIQQMPSLITFGGTIVLKHYLNCADRNGHAGLHQWNFFDDGGEMWLSDEAGTGSVLELVHPCRQVLVSRYTEGRETLVKAIYRKDAP